MFVRPKKIQGIKRLYLVESYRNEEGKSRQRHIAYVDLWSEKDIAKLIRMHEKHREAMTNSNRPGATKAYKQFASKIASKLLKKIDDFKRDMAIKVATRRNRVDRRRGLATKEQNRVPTMDEWNLIKKWLNSFDVVDNWKKLQANRNYCTNGRLRTELRETIVADEWRPKFAALDEFRQQLGI
jgi:hypothetical protein